MQDMKWHKRAGYETDSEAANVCDIVIGLLFIHFCMCNIDE